MAADRRLRRTTRDVSRSPRLSDTAVVVHLHYPDVWPTLVERLSLLPQDLDLFVTVSDPAWGSRHDILRAAPHARLYRTPNLGRDVLPFIRVASGLRSAGYSAVLKLHGKRSVHADDGAEFLDACLKELIPSIEGATRCRELVVDGRAAMVGPASRYYPLAIHVWLNRADLHWFLSRRQPPGAAALEEPSHFGFFAGTMFWANLDRIAECLDVPTRKFEPELGQLDGTMAHALERLFAVVPQLDGYQVWASDDGGCTPLANDSYSWPAWALRRPEME